MVMIKPYNYLFYVLYKFWENVSEPKIWSDAKAVLTIFALIESLVNALMMYYKMFIDKSSHLLDKIWLDGLVGIFFLISFYYCFYYKNRWKQIVSNYDKWPKEKNTKFSTLTWILIVAIVVNFIIACNLYSNSVNLYP